MASRARQKQQARARRLADERAATAKADRVRRLRTLASIVVAAIAVIAVAIAVSAGGTKAGIAQGRAAKEISTQVDSLLAGIPEHGTVLGDPDAKVTLTFFGDLQCPVCAAFATGEDLGGVRGGLPQFIRDQVRPGHAKLVYRSFCTATCNDFSNGQSLFNEQQTAAYAAGEQNRFWYYEEHFYRQQGTEGSSYMTPGFLNRLARQIPGLNFTTWTRERGDSALLSEVQDDEHAANDQLPLVNGGKGTPGLIMAGPKGSRFVNEGATGYGQLQTAVRAVS